MYPVRSGIALECASDVLRDTIIGIAPSLQKDNIVIDEASKWTSLIVPHVLLYLSTLEGSIPVTNEMMNECQAVCGATPIQVQPTETKLEQ